MLLRKCTTAPLNSGLQSSFGCSKMSTSSSHLEEWFWDLPCCKDLAEKGTVVGMNKNFNCISPFLLNSEVEVDFDSSSENSFHTACED